MPVVDRRSGGWVVFVGAFLSLVLIATPANAARGGAKCKIIGATAVTKGVTYTCKKSGKTLKWVKTKIEQVVQGANEIAFSPSTSLLISTQTYPLSGTATSGLPLTYESLTPDICSVTGTTLTLIKPGICTVQASQSGSSLYKTAQSVQVSITIADTQANQIAFSPSVSLLLSTLTYPLAGTATSGLPLTYESLTPDICSVTGATLTLIKLGICTVQASQSGSSLYKPAQSVKVSITIADTRVTSDQVDTVTGFQVKAIFVVPADGVDNSYDTNGYIAGILDEGTKYLREQLGLQIPIDKHALGYDIQYLKTNLSTAYFETTTNGIDVIDKLTAESMALENPGPNRKNYMFFIDVVNLNGGVSCGWGYIPGISAVVAIGKGVDATGARCTVKSRGFNNWAAQSWLHELTHNFGVAHTLDDPCDLMKGAETPGTCPSNQNITYDKERTRYIGSSTQGQDILQLRVWEGNTDRQDLNAYCSLDPIKRADGFNFAYCPTGTQTIGALEYCWGSISTVTLEEFVDGQWKNLGSGSHFSDPWGPNVIWKCNNAGYTAPWKQLTVATPGISLYRWMVNGKESEQFKVIWVR